MTTFAASPHVSVMSLRVMSRHRPADQRCPLCPPKSDMFSVEIDVCFVSLADVERGLAKAPIESEPNFRLRKKSLSGLGRNEFHLRTLLDARLKPTRDCKSTTTQILFTIGEGQIKY